MVGVMEFLFYPNMIYPRLEAEIHEGRKRIDILYTNASQSGIFYRLQALPQTRSHFVPVECKNYSREVANPELDQIAGRFSRERGQFGIVCCRKIDKKDRFVARCRDTANDGRGIILPLDDDDIIQLLAHVGNNHPTTADEYVNRIVQAILS